MFHRYYVTMACMSHVYYVITSCTHFNIMSYTYFKIYHVITSGMTLDSAHIDGLSALLIHDHLRIDMVMEAFVRYIAFVENITCAGTDAV